MASSSSSKTKSSGPVPYSLSPSNQFCSYSTSNAPFHSPSPSSNLYCHHRSTSPIGVNLYNNHSCSFGVRFSIDHQSSSPIRTVSSPIISMKSHQPHAISIQKKKCMCSPTTHPGSFRCSLHKNSGCGSYNVDSFQSNRLNMRRSAMKNSLVRIGGVEGEWVKRALTALIRPSSHQQRRRAAFEPRSSRLSIMSKAEEDL